MANKKEKKDREITIDGLKKEWKRIRWKKFKTTKENGDGIGKLSVEVILFAGTFALLFVGYDALTALILGLVK